MLELSQFESQNFHFVSEDLEIKSNTPQVSKIQENYFETTFLQRKKEQLREKQWQNSKHKLCETRCVGMCKPCVVSRTEDCDSVGTVYCLQATSVCDLTTNSTTELCSPHSDYTSYLISYDTGERNVVV